MVIDMNKKYRTRGGREVRILCVDGPSDCYPVIGIIENFADPDIWTSDGFFKTNKTEHELDLIEVSPYDDFKVDEPVMVRDKKNESWTKRYFAMFAAGHVYCWNGGLTSWSSPGSKDVTGWKQCRRPTEEEMKTCAQ